MRWASSRDRRHLALQAPFGGLEYILAVGVPIAYTATLVAGGPAIWLMRHGGRWALGAVVGLGGLVGLMTALVLAPFLRGDLFSIMLPSVAGAGLGAGSAGAFWRLASHRDPAPAGRPRSASP